MLLQKLVQSGKVVILRAPQHAGYCLAVQTACIRREGTGGDPILTQLVRIRETRAMVSSKVPKDRPGSHTEPHRTILAAPAGTYSREELAAFVPCMDGFTASLLS